MQSARTSSDPATRVDENFINFVASKQLPEARTELDFAQFYCEPEDLLALFDSQMTSRQLDLIARRLKQDNRSFYTIGSSGHEGNAAIARVFRHTDMAFLHYRSGAFFIERMRQINHDPIEDLLYSLMASIHDPVASGRHKVFGSVPGFIPPQTSTIASHLPKAVGAAISLARAKELNIDALLPKDSVIICSFGDASTNHAAAQSAFNTAQWIQHYGYPLPIVFVCEDNGLGISVPTPDDWIEQSFKNRAGIHYIKADGLHIGDTFRAAKQAEHLARDLHQPIFLHMKCVRLLGHAGSDIETSYRSQTVIEATEFQDPLLHTARIILEQKLLSSEEIIKRYQTIAKKMQTIADTIQAPQLDSKKAVMASIVPSKPKRHSPNFPSKQQRQLLFKSQSKVLTLKRNLSQSINLALHDILLRYPSACVLGEDVGKKGGVYHVTADLIKRFGQRRVFDTLLDETTILGTAIGLAHNGFLPIPEIQFLAYYHNAQDQIRGEAATLSFFSDGQYTNPMVVRIPGFAYQKGFGGHFHNDNSIAVLRDLPGVIVACPSHGSDAAKLLRQCVALAYEQHRIVIFLEPIALYMTKDLHEPGDEGWLSVYSDPKETINYGEVGVSGDNNECVILTYANGYYLSRQAQKLLEDKHNIKVKVVDLRWLAPLPEQAILKEVKQAKHILIVDECRKSGSISEALMAMLVEQLTTAVNIKRITGEDSYIPLGNSWQTLLPSRDGIVKTMISMMK